MCSGSWRAEEAASALTTSAKWAHLAEGFRAKAGVPLRRDPLRRTRAATTTPTRRDSNFATSGAPRLWTPTSPSGSTTSPRRRAARRRRRRPTRCSASRTASRPARPSSRASPRSCSGCTGCRRRSSRRSTARRRRCGRRRRRSCARRRCASSRSSSTSTHGRAGSSTLLTPYAVLVHVPPRLQARRVEGAASACTRCCRSSSSRRTSRTRALQDELCSTSRQRRPSAWSSERLTSSITVGCRCSTRRARAAPADGARTLMLHQLLGKLAPLPRRRLERGGIHREAALQQRHRRPAPAGGPRRPPGHGEREGAARRRRGALTALDGLLSDTDDLRLPEIDVVWSQLLRCLAINVGEIKRFNAPKAALELLGLIDLFACVEQDAAARHSERFGRGGAAGPESAPRGDARRGRPAGGRRRAAVALWRHLLALSTHHNRNLPAARHQHAGIFLRRIPPRCATPPSWRPTPTPLRPGARARSTASCAARRGGSRSRHSAELDLGDLNLEPAALGRWRAHRADASLRRSRRCDRRDAQGRQDRPQDRARRRRLPARRPPPLRGARRGAAPTVEHLDLEYIRRGVRPRAPPRRRRRGRRARAAYPRATALHPRHVRERMFVSVACSTSASTCCSTVSPRTSPSCRRSEPSGPSTRSVIDCLSFGMEAGHACSRSLTASDTVMYAGLAPSSFARAPSSRFHAHASVAPPAAAALEACETCDADTAVARGGGLLRLIDQRLLLFGGELARVHLPIDERLGEEDFHHAEHLALPLADRGEGEAHVRLQQHTRVERPQERGHLPRQPPRSARAPAGCRSPSRTRDQSRCRRRAPSPAPS